ncbi:MAG: hypothetical protein EXR82_09880 [Gammaproteobacteria bacterium]|nr:hypothetical protein [Gammaproteobacteria bacterium]
MNHTSDELLLSRRRLLVAGGLGGALASGLAAAPALADDGTAVLKQSPLEAANAALVTRFCLAWNAKDVEQLMPYLADKLVYQMFEKRPDIIGLEEFRREIDPFLKDLARVEWDILRTCTIGQVVINERVDRFIARPGGRSMTFPIVGLFVVQNEKIALWRDYSLPGGKNQMQVEPAV